MGIGSFLGGVGRKIVGGAKWFGSKLHDIGNGIVSAGRATVNTVGPAVKSANEFLSSDAGKDIVSGVSSATKDLAGEKYSSKFDSAVGKATEYSQKADRIVGGIDKSVNSLDSVLKEGASRRGLIGLANDVSSLTREVGGEKAAARFDAGVQKGIRIGDQAQQVVSGVNTGLGNLNEIVAGNVNSKTIQGVVAGGKRAYGSLAPIAAELRPTKRARA